MWEGGGSNIIFARRNWTNLFAQNMWPIENRAYVGPSYNSTSIDGFQMGPVTQSLLLIPAKWQQAVARDVVWHTVLLGLDSSLGQEAATSKHNNISSHFLWYPNASTARGAWWMLVRKLAKCFHHKGFKYCVCLYLAARDPTKDRELKHQKGTGWKEGHLSAELTKGSYALSIASHI